MPGRADVATRRERAARQLLAGGGAHGPVEIVRRLLAVQAQDLRSARLALRARSPGLAVADLDAALEAGTLVIAWLLRGTLHLVAREDWVWLHALTAPRGAATSRRRLAQLGVPPEDAARGVEVIREALSGGPGTRAELAARLAAEGIETAGQATPHLLVRAGLDGVLVSCGEHRYAAAPEREPVDHDAALAELARRYLAAHAPATDADLAAWSGLALRDARQGLRAARTSRSPSSGPSSARSAGSVRLLPAFDPYLLGWKDRSFAVPEALAQTVHPGGGIIRATAIDDGLVVGTWALRGGRVAVDGPADRFAAEAADVERFVSEAHGRLRA